MSQKKNRAVVLVSSMHHTATVDKDIGKPEIISYYNLTKGGVDSLDERCAQYSCGCLTRRWPMAIFYRILDICFANPFVMYGAYQNNQPLARFEFMKTIAKQLVYEHMSIRVTNHHLSHELRSSMRKVLGITGIAPI